MLCHFVEDLLAPALNTLVAKVILVSFIQRQTHEQLLELQKKQGK